MTLLHYPLTVQHCKGERQSAWSHLITAPRPHSQVFLQRHVHLYMGRLGSKIKVTKGHPRRHGRPIHSPSQHLAPAVNDVFVSCVFIMKSSQVFTLTTDNQRKPMTHLPKGCSDRRFRPRMSSTTTRASPYAEEASLNPWPYHAMPCHTMPVCVSAAVHTPARRGGCTGSDPGLTLRDPS